MKDKTLHFFVCFMATAIVSCATFFLGFVPCLFCGSLFSLGLGLGKEYGDSKAKGNKWDWLDIVADCAGIVLALILLWVGFRD